MATINGSLSGALNAHVQAQVETGRYANAADYVRDLIHRDQERAQKFAAMQVLVGEGFASGVAEEFEIGQFLADVRARADVSAEWTRQS